VMSGLKQYQVRILKIVTL